MHSVEEGPRRQPVDGATLLLTSLWAEGIERVYVNIGTDYTAVVEAVALAAELHIAVPELIMCQHEAVALSAAHGEAATSGRATAVFVHADVGTSNLGGALHNVARARVPVLIVAGLTPLTTRGERPGSRSSSVQFLQDVPDQAAIVRPYVRWISEIRYASTVPQIVARALQVARSSPGGPVYLLAPREPLLETVQEVPNHRAAAVARAGQPREDDLDLLATWIGQARLPLVVTSSLGRDPAAPAALDELANAAGLGVCEVGPFAWTNVDTSAPHYLGALDAELIEAADLLLLVDVDTPWVPAQMQPTGDCRVVHIDENPVNPTIPLQDIDADLSLVAASSPTLTALTPRVDVRATENVARRAALVPWRERFVESLHDAREVGTPGALTPARVAALVDAALGDEGLVISEAISNTPVVIPQLRRGRNRLLLGSGGGSLGWGGGAAIGVKQVEPNRDVVWICGDGTFVFSVPTAVYWASRRFGAPFVTVVLDNGGWNAVRAATLEQHPDGAAQRTGRFVSDFEQPIDLAAVAEAAGAAGAHVATEGQLRAELLHAIVRARDGRASVIIAHLEEA